MNSLARWSCLTAIVSIPLLLTSCGRDEHRKPAKFSPERVQLRAEDRIARCNTVHTLTLPSEVLTRYALEPDEDTAVLSCSLQLPTDPPTNIPARVTATMTALSGPPHPLDFKEVTDNGVISYVAPFSIAARMKIQFAISIIDAQTGKEFHLQLTQAELPGRV